MAPIRVDTLLLSGSRVPTTYIKGRGLYLLRKYCCALLSACLYFKERNTLIKSEVPFHFARCIQRSRQ